MRAVLKAQINKTDRNDARGMAQMMQAGKPRCCVDRLIWQSNSGHWLALALNGTVVIGPTATLAAANRSALDAASSPFQSNRLSGPFGKIGKTAEYCLRAESAVAKLNELGSGLLFLRAGEISAEVGPLSCDFKEGRQ